MDASDVIMVHQLLGLYGHIVDAEQWERFDELFEPDAVLDYTAVRAPHVCHGVVQIREYFRTVSHPSAHHVVNIVVSGDADELRVQSKFFVPFTRAAHDPLRWFGGDYDDVVASTAGTWKFRRRVCTGRWQFSAGDSESIPAFRRTW